MPYTICHHANPNIVEVSFVDSISGSDLREATTKAIAFQKENGVNRFLVHTNGSEVISGFIELYDLAEKQYHAEGLKRNSRIAVVFPVTLSAQAAANFYETVCLNRGWNALVHPDRQAAIDWLIGDI